MSNIKRAILSVYNKENIISLGKYLSANSVEILSTGGTAKALREADIPVTDISAYTGFPEILEGRVKTLHPFVHGGILARDTTEHLDTIRKHGISPIDLVVVNLYPFTETIKIPNISEQNAIEMIDIGGPTMIRAAAKNFERVSVLCDPNDYDIFIKADKAGDLSMEMRKKWASKVFTHTFNYDLAISQYFEKILAGEKK